MLPPHPRPTLVTCMALCVTVALFALLWLSMPPTTTHAQSQPEALGSLRGVVRNAQGAPLPNIRVDLQPYRGAGEFRRVTSNSAGEYEFLSLPSGTYVLRFEDNAHFYETRYYVAADFPIDATTVVVNGNNVTNGDMTLAPGGAISLTLESASPFSTTYYFGTIYRQSLNGTWLEYSYFNPASTGERFYLASGLPAGNYRVCAQMFDGISGMQAVECFEDVVPSVWGELADGASDIAVHAEATSTVTINFVDKPQVEGTLVAPGNVPLANLDVLLFDLELSSYFVARTDEHGYFRFAGIPSGQYNLVFNSVNDINNPYVATYYPDEQTPATAQTLVVEPSSHYSFTRQLRPTSRLVGKVTLPHDVPVTYASISVFRQWGDGTFHPYAQCFGTCFPAQIYDNATGVFTVTHLISGKYRVAANYFLGDGLAYGQAYFGGDSLESATTYTLSPAETENVGSMVVGEDLYDGVISGRITDGSKPLAGIEVGLFAFSYFDFRSIMPNFTTVTDAQGRYRLEGLTPGPYRVGAHDPNGVYANAFYPTSKPYTPFEPLPGDILWYSGTEPLDNIDMALTPGATVRGNIHVQHKSAGDYFVQVVRTDEYADPYSPYAMPYADVRSDANGDFVITGLISGTYYLRAYAPALDGESIGNGPVFYPGTTNAVFAKTLTLDVGETATGKNIAIFDTPTSFLPVVNGNPAVPIPTATPAVIEMPGPNGPLPTPTPTFAPPPTPTPASVPLER